MKTCAKRHESASGVPIIFRLLLLGEKKAELKELLKDYCNEENVKLILTELYEKKINQLLMD